MYTQGNYTNQHLTTSGNSLDMQYQNLLLGVKMHELPRNFHC